jgi:hypothetical protein
VKKSDTNGEAHKKKVNPKIETKDSGIKKSK